MAGKPTKALENMTDQVIGQWEILRDRLESKAITRRVLLKHSCGFEFWTELRTVFRFPDRKTCISCSQITHGKTKGAQRPPHPLYTVWSSMKSRCNDQNAPDYSRYGGVGIKICEEWLEFQKFYDWAVASDWQHGLTIDRFPNQKGNYSPENCRIATRKENQANRSNTFMVEWEGNLVPLATLIPNATKNELLRARERIQRGGWAVNKAISTPKVTY